MIAAMNREPLAFVVHVGDFEADPRPYMRNPTTVTEPCTDESFKGVLAQFQQSAHPFILTPGDNDWTDCHLLKTRKVDPLERLAKVRELFYPRGVSLGKRTMPVTSQASDPKFAKFRENLAWTVNNVTFMTMHTVGSNNNRGRTPEMDTEADERMAANIAWLRKAFADAKANNSAGLVLITQANPGFETHWTAELIGDISSFSPASRRRRRCRRAATTISSTRSPPRWRAMTSRRYSSMATPTSSTSASRW